MIHEFRLGTGRAEKALFQLLALFAGSEPEHSPSGCYQILMGVQDRAADQVIQCVPPAVSDLAVVGNRLADPKRIYGPNRASLRRIPIIKRFDDTEPAKRVTPGTGRLPRAKQKQELAGIAQSEFDERSGQLFSRSPR